LTVKLALAIQHLRAVISNIPDQRIAWPGLHGCGIERSQQIYWKLFDDFSVQPTVVVGGFEDDRHTSVDRGH